MIVRFAQPSSVQGELSVPPSKSYTHRALLTALTTGGGVVRNLLSSDDTEATYQLVKSQVREIERSGADVTIHAPQRFEWNSKRLQARESGTLLRFLLPLASIFPGPSSLELVGQGSLLNRSNRDLLESLRENELKIRGTGEDETVPITAYPGQNLPSDRVVTTVADTTSQLLSGWLIGLVALGGGTVKRTTELVSAPYVTMTADVLRETGASVRRDGRKFSVSGPEHPLDYTVPGDYSSAAFWIVAGALTEGTLRLTGLRREDPQADRFVLTILERAGLEYSWEQGGLEIPGLQRPDGFNVDAGDCPDLVPVISVLAVYGEGESRIERISHLTNKESDRIRRTAQELRKTGVGVEPSEDSLTVRPQQASWYPDWPNFEGTPVFESHNDHRLAMAFSVIGMVSGSVELQGAESVSKSYPEFFEDCRALEIRFEREQ